MTFYGAINEISKLEVPIYQEPCKNKIIETLVMDYREWTLNRELWKKALYMACNGNDYLVEDFIQKAREEQ